jgi:aspartate aminotransferase
VYIGTPTWGNYEPLCSLVGLKVVKYPYYNPETATVNFQALRETVARAPPNSVFILQACCHNPTGVDLSKSQWKQLAAAMKAASCFPLMDIAYHGLGGSMEDDAYAIRLFAEMDFDMLVCQSFSKNLGLYGERCGALHVFCSSSAAATNVYDQLRCFIRWEFSSSPLYGSRLADIVLESPSLQASWSVLPHHSQYCL